LSAVLAVPRAMATVPEETFCDALVELVKVANVPRPAMLAVTPIAATDSSSFLEVRFDSDIADSSWTENLSSGRCIGSSDLVL
jgi:hypothetical protein